MPQYRSEIVLLQAPAARKDLPFRKLLQEGRLGISSHLALAAGAQHPGPANMNAPNPSDRGNQPEINELLKIEELLAGLGEVRRRVDDLGRVRLPSEWGRLRVVPWFHNCAAPGVISVFPVSLRSHFLQQQRRQFAPRPGPVTFGNTAFAVLKPLGFQRAANGWRCSLSPAVREFADIGPGDHVYVRVLGAWWEIRSGKRRSEVITAFHQPGPGCVPASACQ